MCHTNLGRRGGFFCGYFETEVSVPSHMEAQEAVSNENTDFQVTSLYEEVGTLKSYQPTWNGQTPVFEC